MPIRVKIILVLAFLIITNSYLSAQGYIVPKGCLNCPPHPIKEKIEMSFYYEKGNPECIKVQKLLEILSLFSSNISLQMRDITLSNNKESFDILMEIYYKNLNQKKKVPAIFFENKMLIGYEDIYNEIYLPIMAAIERKPPKTIQERISNFLREMKIYIISSSGGLLSTTVMIAGLIDGINPCAISILIFLIFSLSKLKDKRKQIVTSGLSFILGIFVTYLFIGIGLLKLTITSLFISIYNLVFIGMGILAFVLGGLNILDFYYARKGNIRKIKLQLPLRYKKISHFIIRKVSLTNLLIIFCIGALMSLIEFPCSGQVYLPTITLIGNPLSNFRPFLLLLLYNFMFILPLIGIVIVSILWLSSEKVSIFISQKLTLIKLSTAIFFFLIGTYMLILS